VFATSTEGKGIIRAGKVLRQHKGEEGRVILRREMTKRERRKELHGPPYVDRGSLMLTEEEPGFLKLLRRIGFGSKELSDGRDHWGVPTAPFVQKKTFHLAKGETKRRRVPSKKGEYATDEIYDSSDPCRPVDDKTEGVAST